MFEKEIKNLLSKHVKGEITLEVPPKHEMGDYAFPCFPLAKELKKSPPQIAEDLKNKIGEHDFLERTVVIGPYLNFFVDKKKLAEKVLKEVYKKKQEYGKGSCKKVIAVEFSSPNTNKPLHLGHVRNICLGESVCKILEFNGNKVKRHCVVNDRGIHICKSMLAYKKFGKGKEPDVKSDFFVGNFYVRFAKEVEKNPKLDEEAQALLVKWESEDKETIALWKKMNKWVYDGFDETYKKLGIKFDKYYYESSLYKEGKDIVVKGLDDGVFDEEDNGAVSANLDKFKLPKKILMRGDGTTIYMTQDLFLAKKKFQDFKCDKSIYVVGSEQNLHFQQLFAVLELLGEKFAKNCSHLSYGMVNLPDGKMKSREGKVVDADDLVREMEELSRYEIKLRHKDIEEDELADRSYKVGLGALKFFILKMDPSKEMMYDPEASVSFEGETGPYVQYTIARINSILRKYDGKVSDKVKFDIFEEDGVALIKLLQNFPAVVDEAGSHLRPSNIARYLLDLSQAFNEFYHSSPILQEKEDVKKARLLLSLCVKEVLVKGLDLLGISYVEEM